MRVRLGQRNQSEQRAFETFAAGVERLFDAALASSREAGWWRQRVRALSPELDAESWGDSIVLRAQERGAWPVCEWISARAPRKLGVVCGRPPLGFEQSLASLGSRGKRFERASARAGFTRGHLLEVVVNLPGGNGSEEEIAAAESLVWALLGERRADAWIGAVKVAPAARGGALRVLTPTHDGGFALNELPKAVDAAVAGLYAGLPERPHWARADSNEWTMFELEPEELPDWADEDDLVMASTCVPELLKSRLSKQPFSSQRFSRHGELFFHLKYVSGGGPERRLQTRQRLEDALDSALVKAELGRVVGAGLGLRYSYVLLALSDAERALSLSCQLLRGQEISKKAWLLPLDSDWEREWCGVWDDSPAPYGVPASERKPVE